MQNRYLCRIKIRNTEKLNFNPIPQTILWRSRMPESINCRDERCFICVLFQTPKHFIIYSRKLQQKSLQLCSTFRNRLVAPFAVFFVRPVALCPFIFSLFFFFNCLDVLYDSCCKMWIFLQYSLLSYIILEYVFPFCLLPKYPLLFDRMLDLTLTGESARCRCCQHYS